MAFPKQIKGAISSESEKSSHGTPCHKTLKLYRSSKCDHFFGRERKPGEKKTKPIQLKVAK